MRTCNVYKSIFHKIYKHCDFDIFNGSIGCATKVLADEISFFLSISVGSKVIAFFCQKIAKVEHTICDCN